MKDHDKCKLCPALESCSPMDKTEIELHYLTAPFTPGWYYIYHYPNDPEASKGCKEHGPFESKDKAIMDCPKGILVIDKTVDSRYVGFDFIDVAVLKEAYGIPFCYGKNLDDCPFCDLRPACEQGYKLEEMRLLLDNKKTEQSKVICKDCNSEVTQSDIKECTDCKIEICEKCLVEPKGMGFYCYECGTTYL